MSVWTTPPGPLARRGAASLAGHALLGLGLGVAAIGAESLPPGWHAGAGVAGMAAFGLALLWRLLRPLPPCSLWPLAWAATLLRALLAITVVALAASGWLFGDPVWGARSALHEGHEALAAAAAGLLALHALAEAAAFAWAGRARPAEAHPALS